MPPVTDLIQRPGPVGAPYAYVLGNTEVLRPVCAYAHFDGTGASGPFLACLSFKDNEGNVIMRVFPSTQVTAGASADVSYAPFPGGLTTGGGPSGPETVQVPVGVDTPDVAANGYPALSLNNGFTNVRRLLPAFTTGVDGTWSGSVRIPDNYGSGGIVRLSWVANATSGNLRHRVSSAVVADGVSEDTAYTDEGYINTAVPGTALQRFSTAFTLSTTPAAGASLNVKVTRNGTSGSDTLAVDALLYSLVFEYVTA